MNHNIKPPGQSGFKLLWHAYKGTANKKRLYFALSEDFFRTITSADCHYCGSPPTGKIATRTKEVTPEGRLRGTYTYNGVDRVNNRLGYTVDNVVPCCKNCNLAKRGMTVAEFLAWAERLVAFQRSHHV